MLFFEILIVIVWTIGFVGFFKLKKIVKKQNPVEHDRIFGKHWTEHSIRSSLNYLKLVFYSKNWKEFETKEFRLWVKICYLINLIAVLIVFYPILKLVMVAIST